MGKETVNKVQEVQSPRQDKLKEEYTETHSNQVEKLKTNKILNKGKMTHSIQRSLHKVNMISQWKLCKPEGNGTTYLVMKGKDF